MLPISPDTLRKITQEAISAATTELHARKKQIFLASMSQLQNDVIAGRNFTIAMSLKSGVDFDPSYRKGQILRPEGLTGVASLIWQDCAVFAPTLEYWSKVEGSQRDEYTVDGFNIVLHWTGVEDLLKRLDSVKDIVTAGAVRQGIEKAQAAIGDKAAAILSQLKDKAMVQAAAGKSWAIVMSIKPGVDFHIPQGHRINQIEADWLGPVARAVWDACLSFKPSFEYWSRTEGDQRDSYVVEGINILVHW